MASASAGKLLSALFVDFDNIYLSLKSRNEEAATRFARHPALWFSQLANGTLIKTSMHEPGIQRRIAVARCYGNPIPWRLGRNGPEDPNCFAFVRNDFMRAGMEVVDCPKVTSHFKNCSDIRIACDIRDYLDHPVRFDEFIILSGDADFTPVLLHLRSHDRRRAIYTNKSTSPYYRAFCDGWVEESELIGHLLQAQGLAAPVEPAFELGYSRPRMPETIPVLTPKPALPNGDMTSRRRVTYQGDGAVQSLIEDFKAISAEIIDLIVEAVDKSPKPVALAFLADRAQKILGQPKTTGSNWAGCGNFLTFVTRNLPPKLKISEKPPHVVYNPAIHDYAGEQKDQAPVRESRVQVQMTQHQPAAPQSNSDRIADLQRSITRIYEACQAPPLPPSEYQLLFTLIAAEVREHGFQPNLTSQSVVARARDAGLKLALKDVSFVLGAVDEIDPWLEQTRSAAAVARAYRDYVLGRCRAAGLHLTDDEHQLIQVWFGASQWGQPRRDNDTEPLPSDGGPRGPGGGSPGSAGMAHPLMPSHMRQAPQRNQPLDRNEIPLPPGLGLGFETDEDNGDFGSLARSRFNLSKRN